MYGNPSLISYKDNRNLKEDLSQLAQQSQLLGIDTVVKNNSVLLDKEYQSVLNELTNKESLKKKLEREKNQAYQEL